MRDGQTCCTSGRTGRFPVSLVQCPSQRQVSLSEHHCKANLVVSLVQHDPKRVHPLGKESSL